MDVDDLYGLPLDQFVPERTALARELRKAGNRDDATEVAALRKPSVAAWAVNQLVRTQRRGVAELLEAGDALRSAQEDVLAGRGDARSLRAAVDGERTAVEALTRAARGLLTSEGDELSPAIIERVADTLHAAALDPESREQVREGRLERELRHVGLGTAAFGGGSATPATAGPARKKSSTGGKKSQADGKEAAGGRTEREPATVRAERERAERDRAQARGDARAAEREARRRAERAGRGAKLALERRDRAAEALREADAGLEAAEAEVQTAEDALREAEAAVRDAGL